MPRPTKQSSCHPERKHFAKGLCSACYSKALRKKTPYSEEQKSKRSAYMVEWRKRNPEKLSRYSSEKDRAKANEATQRWRQCNPYKVRLSQWATDLKTKYGLTVGEYESMLASQQHACAICGGDNGRRKLAVDHCHATGQVRGLLCSGCNYAVGWAEKRTSAAHQALLSYVAVAQVVRESAA